MSLNYLFIVAFSTCLWFMCVSVILMCYVSWLNKWTYYLSEVYHCLVRDHSSFLFGKIMTDVLVSDVKCMCFEKNVFLPLFQKWYKCNKNCSFITTCKAHHSWHVKWQKLVSTSSSSTWTQGREKDRSRQDRTVKKSQNDYISPI